jgi:hypothetical protein
MSLKYSVEISYKLDNELKLSQIDLMQKYMQIIKENKEIAEKDMILNNLGTKYCTDMNSHDFDVAISNPITPGTVKIPITFCHIFLENVSEMIGF